MMSHLLAYCLGVLLTLALVMWDWAQTSRETVLLCAATVVLGLPWLVLLAFMAWHGLLAVVR